MIRCQTHPKYMKTIKIDNQTDTENRQTPIIRILRERENCEWRSGEKEQTEKKSTQSSIQQWQMQKQI